MIKAYTRATTSDLSTTWASTEYSFDSTRVTFDETFPWVERDLKMDQWQVRDVINGRSVATLTLIDPTGTQFYQRGVNLKIESNDVPLFEGYITRATESRLGLGGAREHNLECADQHYLADKRVVAEAFTNETSADIVQTIIDDYLAAEGIRPGNIATGATIRELTFNYVTASAALQELAERNGYWWAIQPDRTLDFLPPGTDPVDPRNWDSTLISFDSVTVRWDDTLGQQRIRDVALADSISIRRANDSYRNTQWIRGGRARTDLQTETQVGDGTRQTFTVGYPIAEQPIIEVDTGSGFVAQDVGVAGFDSGKDWYFSFNSLAVVQDPLGTPLSATDRIRVTYTGLFDVLARVDDVTQIATTRAFEGGSGIVEVVEDNKRITTRDGALELGAELLAYYANSAFTIRYATSVIQFQVGQTVRITYPEGNIPTATTLLAECEYFSLGGELRQVLTFVSGPVEGTWEDYFRKLTTRLDKAAERAGGEIQVVTTVQNFSKTWTPTELPNIFLETLPGSGLFPDSDVVPSFVPEQRVRFLAWFDGPDEVARKPITLQTGANTNEIVTTTLLGVNDAVGTFTDLGWFGGATASDIVGTGVLVDKQAFAFTKTNIEQILVVKTDTKWT